jgi:tRNA threonylcarbamoyl adenosine modification protein YeaZ
MRTLAIDSATEACSVALFDDDRLVAGEWRMLGRGHAELLVPMIAALPENGRADRIVVALGPGSFTGVRVGLAAARALAFAWQARLQGYSTLDLVAAMALHRSGPQPLAVAMTGGHGEWFVKSYSTAGATLFALASLTPDAASAALTEPLVAGSQAEALVAARGVGVALQLWPDAREFSLLPATGMTDAVHPLYGRAPDAKLPQSRSIPANLKDDR